MKEPSRDDSRLSCHVDSERAGRRTAERIRRLARDPQPEPVGPPAAHRREPMDVVEPAAAVAADGRERPPARRRPAPGSRRACRRAARGRRGAGRGSGRWHRQGACSGEPGTGPAPVCARSCRHARAGAGRRRRTPRAASATVRPADGPRSGRRRRCRTAQRDVDDAARAATTTSLPQTVRHARRPRSRCVSASARPASGRPPAVSRARSVRPERRTLTDVRRRSGSVTVAAAPSARRVPIASFPATSATTARSSYAPARSAASSSRPVSRPPSRPLASRCQSPPARRSSIRPPATPDVASATTTRTRVGSAGSGASNATVSGGVRSTRTAAACRADAFPAPSTARKLTVWRPSRADLDRTLVAGMQLLRAAVERPAERLHAGQTRPGRGRAGRSAPARATMRRAPEPRRRTGPARCGRAAASCGPPWTRRRSPRACGPRPASRPRAARRAAGSWRRPPRAHRAARGSRGCPRPGARPPRRAAARAPFCQRSAAETSGAPGCASSKRSVNGAAYGPTFPAASSSATRTAYSPGPAGTWTGAVADPPRTESAGAVSAQPPPSRHAFTRARTSGAAWPPGSGSDTVRVRARFQPAPSTSVGAGSPGAVLSARTVRATQVQLPPPSIAPSRSACTPSAHVRVSSVTPIAPFWHGTGRVSSQPRAASWTGRPSSSTRPARIPLLSAASNAMSCTPRSQPSPTRPPRTPPSDGADSSARWTRTCRSAMNPWRASRRQRAASQRTSASIRCVASPRSSLWIHCSTVVRQCSPHHSHAPWVASSTPDRPARIGEQLGVEVEAGDRGARRRVERQRRGHAAARDPRADHVAHDHPLARLRARQSTTPPGQATYAVASRDGSHSAHEPFSGPKHAETAYPPACEAAGSAARRTSERTAAAAEWSGKRMTTRSGRGAGTRPP